jgi:hypothetical protein
LLFIQSFTKLLKILLLYVFLVGIDIPDYISAGGNQEAINNMSSKLKALGKRR